MERYKAVTLYRLDALTDLVAPSDDDPIVFCLDIGMKADDVDETEFLVEGASIVVTDIGGWTLSDGVGADGAGDRRSCEKCCGCKKEDEEESEEEGGIGAKPAARVIESDYRIRDENKLQEICGWRW